MKTNINDAKAILAMIAPSLDGRWLHDENENATELPHVCISNHMWVIITNPVISETMCSFVFQLDHDENGNETVPARISLPLGSPMWDDVRSEILQAVAQVRIALPEGYKKIELRIPNAKWVRRWQVSGTFKQDVQALLFDNLNTAMEFCAINIDDAVPFPSLELKVVWSQEQA